MAKDMKGSYASEYNRKYAKGLSDLQDGKHEKQPRMVDAFKAQKDQNKGLRECPQGSRGYPDLAWDYKY